MKKTCYFVSDLHGRKDLYEILFNQIKEKKPDAVFFGGDLVPAGALYSIKNSNNSSFITEYLAPSLLSLKEKMLDDYPDVFIIMGNDDPRLLEKELLTPANKDLFEYVNQRYVKWDGFVVMGYSFVPPTPFLLKDWEKNDVSSFVNPGCVAPGDGFVSIPISEKEKESTIEKDLEVLTEGLDLSKTIFLFHSPPYKTGLDRAELDEISIDNEKVDVHVGSHAIKELIEMKQPLVSLHGHIHEAPRLTGRWKEKIDQTWAFSAAHDREGLALVEFDPYCPENAVRVVL